MCHFGDFEQSIMSIYIYIYITGDFGKERQHQVVSEPDAAASMCF